MSGSLNRCAGLRLVCFSTTTAVAVTAKHRAKAIAPARVVKWFTFTASPLRSMSLTSYSVETILQPITFCPVLLLLPLLVVNSSLSIGDTELTELSTRQLPTIEAPGPTPELLTKLKRILSSGVLVVQACAAVDISDTTLDNWRAADPALDDAVKRSLMKWESRLVGYMIKHAKRQPRAAEWLLERATALDRKHVYAEAATANTVQHSHLVGVLPGELLEKFIGARARVDAPMKANIIDTTCEPTT